jgi:hypothetical protein
MMESGPSFRTGAKEVLVAKKSPQTTEEIQELLGAGITVEVTVDSPSILLFRSMSVGLDWLLLGEPPESSEDRSLLRVFMLFSLSRLSGKSAIEVQADSRETDLDSLAELLVEGARSSNAWA